MFWPVSGFKILLCAGYLSEIAASIKKKRKFNANDRTDFDPNRNQSSIRIDSHVIRVD